MASGKDGTELLVLQATALNLVGRIKVSTKKPEHAEADGKGNMYLASRDENPIYCIDVKTMKVTAQWPTPGCIQTNGLALDTANNRIILGVWGNAAVKPSFAVMNAETGAIISTAEIGGGNDGVIYDADLQRVFLSGGVSAVLNVFEQVNADTHKQTEALGTWAGARTTVIDPKTKKNLRCHRRWQC
jgi:DNA-binding beta-propeller fold protein YncE